MVLQTDLCNQYTIIESSYASLKKEEVYTTTYSDFEEAKRALFSYISSISYLTPQEFEDLSREEIA
ncbi:IS3 family transposase [Enterococcus faecium]|uniref:IS3 family transposase n=1 Tax=Enterococcus faecium TaxID=1352 RepID=UPI00190ED9C5